MQMRGVGFAGVKPLDVTGVLLYLCIKLNMCFVVKFDFEYSVRSILHNICLLFILYLQEK